VTTTHPARTAALADQCETSMFMTGAAAAQATR
jgi:hypothetical protein